MLLAGVLLAPAVAAASEHVRLELTRGPGAEACPDGTALSDAVAARLGYEPFTADADLRLIVRFERDGTTLRGSVEIKDATGAVKGERSLTSRGADCEELAAATSLTVSILLDPHAGLGPPRPAPIPEPPPTLPTLQVAPREPPAEVPEAKPATKTPIHLRVVADATGSIGLLPAPSVGVLAGAGVAWGRLSLDVEVRGDALASKTFGARDVSASFVAGGLTPCVRVGPARACGVAQLGVLRAAVTDATPATVAAAVLLLGPRLGVSLPLASWLALDAHADALFAPTVKVRVDTGDIWSSSVVSGLLGLGVIGSFL